MPPVNVREDRLEDALAVLRSAAAATRPVSVTLGPPTTFLPTNPVLYLAVAGDVEAVWALRDRVFVEPLTRSLTWPFLPHVTVLDGGPPARLDAAVTALAGYRAEVTFNGVHLLQEGRDEAGVRVWRPIAEVGFGAPGVVDMPGTVLEPLAPTRKPPATDPGHGDVTYASLWLPDVEAAAAFYAAVLRWRLAPGSGSQGRLVEGVNPPLGLWGGQQHRTTFLCFAVDDVAVAVERVRVAGGEAGQPRREHGGLLADCADDQGLAFSLSQAGGGAPGTGERPAPGHGELAYLTLGVPDTARAQAFFSAVLGWRFTPGRVEGGWNVEGVAPMAGMHGGAGRPVVVPMFAVDDVDTAVDRVRAAGGTATDPEQMPYGITSDCTDDQGSPFYLGQL